MASDSVQYGKVRTEESLAGIFICELYRVFLSPHVSYCTQAMKSEVET